MGAFKVTTPAPGYAGKVGAVQFADGVAVMDSDIHAAELAYVTAAGYVVEDLAAEPVVSVDVDGDGTAEELPSKRASTDVWRAFAVEHGMAEDEANGKSRDELAAFYYEKKASA